MKYEVWVSRNSQSFVHVGDSDQLWKARRIAKAAASQGYRYEIIDAKTKTLVEDNYL